MTARGENPKSKPDRLAQTAPTLLSNPTCNAGVVRAGAGCLNSFSASISGASAGVRLPSGEAAA